MAVPSNDSNIVSVHETTSPAHIPIPHLSKMSDFLARESELLGGSFSEVTGGLSSSTNPEDIDLDAAASAFPDISLDGDISSLPAPSAPSAPPADTFSFDAFDPAPRSAGRTDVKVTGDDEIEKFESNFPDIGSPEVCSVPYTTHARRVHVV